jgi:hypothetical protein
MDSAQPTFALTPPALEPYGGPHFTGEEVADDPRTLWLGDPSSVPLAAETADEDRLEPDGAELDRAIFAALITP